MLKSKELLDEVNLGIATLQNFIRPYAKINFTDINISAENLVADVLNSLFDWNLVNANTFRQNYPCIDLLDASNGIGVQITSEKGSKKVNETLSCVLKNKLKLKRIIIFTLTPRQKSYILKPCPCKFDPKADILDFDGIIIKANGVPFEALSRLHSKIKEHMPFLTSRLNCGLDAQILDANKYIAIGNGNLNPLHQEIFELIKNKNKDLALYKLDEYAKKVLEESAEMIYELANLYALLDPLKAELFYKKAANLHPEKIASANIHALNLMKLGQLDEAEKIFKSCLKFPDLTQIQREHLNGNLGILKKNKSQYSKAIEYHRSALKLTRKEDKEGFANHFNNLGICYNHLENYVLSGGYFRKAREIIENAIDLEEDIYERNRLKLKNSNFLTNASVQLQYLAAQRNDPNLLLEAKALLFRAIDIAELLKEKLELTRHYGNLSNVYKAMQDYEKAKKYLLKSYELAISNNDHHGELTNLVNLGNLMIKENVLGEAEKFLTDALAKEQNNYPKLRAEILGNFAILYKKQRKIDESKRNFILAERIYKNLGLLERTRKLSIELEMD